VAVSVAVTAVDSVAVAVGGIQPVPLEPHKEDTVTASSSLTTASLFIRDGVKFFVAKNELRLHLFPYAFLLLIRALPSLQRS
jgi:hypothetical protein